MDRNEIGDFIGRCATLASLLEVSAYPKPGNVHRTRDLPDTRFEHFLAGSVAFGPSMNKLGIRGSEVSSNKRNWKQIGLGKSIFQAVEDSLNWQSGGNVNLGIVLLFAPISVAAGATLQEFGMINIKYLRNNLEKVVKHSTYNDSKDLYRAINLSMNLNTLGTVDELDVNDIKSFHRIESEKITPKEIFELCAHRDLICKEWTTNFHITFRMGYPKLKSTLKVLDTNSAILDSFLYLLSKFPDSLITRKSGVVKSQEVSNRAREIIKIGGTSSKEGMKMIWEFDDELHSKEGSLNPGTIADLTAASIFLTLLEGWKP